MADITAITAFLGSIKTATEIAKAIKISNLSLEKAETKLKIAELIETLADAKMNAVEIRESLQEKDDEIRHLKSEITLLRKAKKIQPDKKELEILKIFGRTEKPYRSEELAEIISVQIIEIKFHLERLEKMGFIRLFNDKGSYEVELVANGRNFIISKKLHLDKKTS